jgi:hypothetical protein
MRTKFGCSAHVTTRELHPLGHFTPALSQAVVAAATPKETLLPHFGQRPSTAILRALDCARNIGFGPGALIGFCWTDEDWLPHLRQ